MSPADQQRQRTALHWAWSWPSLMVIVIVMLTAILGPWFGEIEGIVAPVTTKVTLENIREADGNTYFTMRFTKLRNCELRGVTIRRNGVSVASGPAPGEPTPSTVSPGPRQSQMWFAFGGLPVDGLEIIWAHRCTFLWTTITRVYP